MDMLRRLILSALLMAPIIPVAAQNPLDAQRVERQVKRIHDNSIKKIAEIAGQPQGFIASFLPGGDHAGNKLSEELELTAKQYRAVRTAIAQRNFDVREAYISSGMVIPKNTDIAIL